jgi:hypothetical protein
MYKSKYTQRLGDDKTYKRPDVTYQEKLTKEEIKEKLDGYVKVIDINDVPLNTHMRYFIIDKDGNKVFRTGGMLQNKDNADTYVILSNGKLSWSVQIENAIFFKKLTHNDELNIIHEMYKKKLDEKDAIIAELNAKLHANSKSKKK